MRLTDFAAIYTPNPRRARPETQRVSQAYGNDSNFGVAPLPPVITIGPVILQKPSGTTTVTLAGAAGTYTTTMPTAAEIMIVQP